MLPLLRKAINILLYESNFEARYILFIIKKIFVNNLKINNPFGVAYYCNEGRNITEWNKLKANIEYKKIKDDIIQSSGEIKTEFTYIPNNKKWTDLI